MMQLTEEQRKALDGLCRIEIKRWKAASESNPNMRYMVELMEIALAALESPALAAPAVHDGYVIVPRALTAENGAKSALLGEFNMEYNLECHECFGEGCDDCSGEGRWINSIPVDWTTIKEIWAKGVEHFQATAPAVPAGWTHNLDADAALVMLDRLDTLDPADDARIEDVKLIIRKLAAEGKE